MKCDYIEDDSVMSVITSNTLLFLEFINTFHDVDIPNKYYNNIANLINFGVINGKYSAFFDCGINNLIVKLIILNKINETCLNKLCLYKGDKINASDLIHLMNHKSDNIRYNVAKLIEWNFAKKMLGDICGEVRAAVLNRNRLRIKHEIMVQMINDPYERVRYFVASNIDKKYLIYMINDSSSYIRSIVASRIDKKHLHLMLSDKYDDVVYAVVRRMRAFDEESVRTIMQTGNKKIKILCALNSDKKYLKPLMCDEDDDVRILATARYDGKLLSIL